MEWYNILVLLLGGFGGISGVISLYHAKSNKDTIDIKNLHSIIEDERKERETLAKEYYQYRHLVEEKVASVKKDFEELKAENQKMIMQIIIAIIFFYLFNHSEPDSKILRISSLWLLAK